MELCIYKQKRDERVKFYFKNGYGITYCQEVFAIDEDLVRSIVGSIKPTKILRPHATKSLKVNGLDWQ